MEEVRTASASGLSESPIRAKICLTPMCSSTPTKDSATVWAMYSSYVAPWSLSLVMVRRRPDLASEDAVADDRVEQHQRENDDARSPEHEGETGIRRRRFL